jgi:hypothetical protein
MFSVFLRVPRDQHLSVHSRRRPSEEDITVAVADWERWIFIAVDEVK